MSARVLLILAALPLTVVHATAEATPTVPALRDTQRSLRFDTQHASITVPEGWVLLDDAVLERINLAAVERSLPIRYFAGLVPPVQPEGSPVYVLFQWEGRALSLTTRERIEGEIRTNLDATIGGAPADARTSIVGPTFDWTKTRVSFRVEQTINGMPSTTLTTGHLGATGILWVHCYPPVVGAEPDTYTPLLNGIADSVRFDPGYSFEERGGDGGPDRQGTGRVRWVAPACVGAALAIVLLLIKVRSK